MHGNTISEEDFRKRILRAVDVLMGSGRPITLRTLRKAGARGGDRRISEAAQDLVREGLIPIAAWNEDRDRRTAVNPALVSEHELAARDRSAEWLAEHDARWRRIRRIGEGQPCGS